MFKKLFQPRLLPSEPSPASVVPGLEPRRAPVPPDEDERLAATYQLRLLNSSAEERFNRLTRLAAECLRAPIAFISLVDDKREWFKSTQGLENWREISREESFAAHALCCQEREFFIPDLAKDARFVPHPLLKEARERWFFAGHTLCSSSGYKVGMLGVMGPHRDELSPGQLRALADIAGLAEQELRGMSLRDTLDKLARAERKLEEQDARFAAFMDNMPNVAFIKDAEDRTIFVNPYHEKLFGVRFHQVNGKRDDEWLPAEIAAQTMAADHEVLRTGKTLRIEEEIPTVLGRRHWLTFKFPVPTPSGERLLGGIAVDMTVQKDAEQRLEELLSLQNALLNSANVAIVSTDQSGMIRTFNKAAEGLLGYTAEEIVGRATPDIWHDPPELRAIADKIARETGESVPAKSTALRWGLRVGDVVEHELTFIRKNRSTFRGLVSITALLSGGASTGFIGIVQDITARRETEEAQRRAKEEAEEANEAKSRFVANMSHEIRTPLNGILGVTNMLIEANLPPRERRLAALIMSSAQGLLSVVNDILDFSKIEVGRLELEATDFNLSELVGSVCELHSTRAIDKGLAIETDFATDLPVQLHGDEVRLRQILNNLLSNAVKFSENGQIRVIAEALSRDERHVLLRVQVCDCGLGIPQDKLCKIFEPFTQADISTTRLFGGTGLGLAICHQLVELMGGSIGVESEVGRGSVFWFTVPLEIDSGESAEVVPEEEQFETFTGLRVLVAEDSAINCLVTTHQLERAGCHVNAVENGEEALEMATTQYFDLILMDCQMPVMDGFEAAALIREHEADSEHRTHIIAVTANALAGEREKCLAAGMDGYLAKPFQPATLYAEIRRTLQRADDDVPMWEDGRACFDPRAIAALKTESERSGGAFFQKYVHCFGEDVEEARGKISQAVAERNWEQIKRIVHRLRGAAGNFGARHLMELCSRVEREIHEHREGDALETLVFLNEEIAQVKEALSALDDANVTGSVEKVSHVAPALS